MTPPTDPRKESRDYDEPTTSRKDLNDTDGFDLDEALCHNMDLHVASLEEKSNDFDLTSAGNYRELHDVVERLHQTSAMLASQPYRSAAQAIETPETVGKYEVQEVLGKGGQGSALLAFDPDLKRRVVLKVYSDSKESSQDERLRKEGQSLARVDSPFIAQCFGIEHDGEKQFLVMQYIAGPTLAQHFKTKQPELDESLRLIRHIAEGLAAVHARGLIHRDIKPANIILAEDGVTRLVDFGLASNLASDELQEVSGTPAYMPPEQARGEAERVDFRSDIFSLGAVLYEMLGGHAPYRGPTASRTWQLAQEGNIADVAELRPDLPQPIAELCMQCLAKSPELRPQSAMALIEAIDRIQSPPRLQVPWLWAGTAVLASTLLLMVWSFGAGPWTPNETNSKVGSDGAGTANAEPNIVFEQQSTWEKSGQVRALLGLEGRPLRRNFEIQVQFEGGKVSKEGLELKSNSNLRITIKSPRDCYVGIWSFQPHDPNSDVFFILPNAKDTDQKLLKDETKVAPRELALKLSKSEGPEFLYIMASTKPLPDLPRRGEAIYATKMETLNSNLRSFSWASEDTKPDDDPAFCELVIPYQIVDP